MLNDLTIGIYDITVSTGPSYSTMRQEASEAMVAVAGDFPKLMDVAGDLVIESMDWPGADKIAARLKKTMPPELTKDDSTEGEEGAPPALPPEIEQHIQQADQLIDQLQQELKDAKSGVDKARIDAESRERIAEQDNATKLRVAEINAGVMLDKEELINLRAELQHHHRLEQQTQQADHQHDANEHTAELQAEQTRLAASQAADQAQPGPTDATSGS